ncbi:MAG: hypothetical protein ABIQ35_05885 [Verrucomicrobiota bacterium]
MRFSLLDFKTLEMDRVLTMLFARIHHNGYDSRLFKRDNTIDTFEAHFLSQPTRFKDFDKYPNITRGWLETHLLDLVNRGKPGKEAVAAPRPLHGYTYRFRNANHCRDYGAAQHIFEMLWHARNNLGKRALANMKVFFFAGVDPNTQLEDTNAMVDVETQALLSLNSGEVSHDAPLNDSRQTTPPLCVGSADIMADDLVRLLQYRNKIPRSVMVEYLKILLAFHLALYHLRLMKLLPELVKRKGQQPICQVANCPAKPADEDRPQGDCPYQIGLFLDVQNQPGTRVSQLAEISAELHYRRIPGFVRAYFVTKKLDEFALHLLQSSRLPGGTNKQLSVSEVLRLLEEGYKVDREQYFGSRLMSLEEDTALEDNALDPEVQAVKNLQLDPLGTYVECLMALRGDYHRTVLVRSLDSLLLKNRPGPLLA